MTNLFPRITSGGARRAVRLLISLLVVGATAGLQGAEPDWVPVPLRTAAMKADGDLGGEGAQVLRALVIAPGDPNFMIWGTDVGGLFRSLDGGRRWEPANIGYFSRGSTALAVDPHNPARVISLGTNSVPAEANGLYLTEDRAASWREVFRSSTPMANNADERRQIAFDPSTYDPAQRKTLVAYWARAEFETAIWRKPEPYPMLYKTTDGGETWREVPEGRAMAGAAIAVHPKNGYVYAAHRTGFHVSRDGGLTWKPTLEGRARSVDVSPAAPDSVWVATDSGLHRSDDGGRTWRELPRANVFRGGDFVFSTLTVSPSHPERLVVWQFSTTRRYQYPRFFSHDGGRTWRESRVDGGKNILPTNARRGHFAFHPTNPDILLANGGDFPTISTDGGATYRWSANGINNVLVGNSFNFSVVDPNVLFLGSQDYGTILTTDGGDTWRYFAPGGKGWGGYNYGGYATTPESLVVGESGGWSKPRTLAYSTNGGANWTVTQLEAQGSPVVGYGDPRNPRTLFWAQYRSTDAGKTWRAMSGVSSVHTHDAADGSLWGVDRSSPERHRVVRSTDGGATWKPVGGAEREISDVAVHRGAAFAVVGRDLSRLEGEQWIPVTNLPVDYQDRVPRVRSVAIDPVDPRVVYVAASENHLISDVGPIRSVDGGRTWQGLRRSAPLGEDGRLDGASTPHWVRVNPKTREAWWVTSCKGVWKIAAP
jgi:photosystem II stability/assembly factor-like uncharacterized protein